MRFDRYDIFARLIPAVICLVPIIVLNYYFLSTAYSQLFSQIQSIKLIGGATVSLCFLFLIMYLGRLVGTIIETKLFDHGLRYPTTNLLVINNTELSASYKERVYVKLKKDFGLDIAKNNSASLADRQLINEAVGSVRRKFRNNPMVMNRNIYFGFIKNLIGGSMAISLPISIITAILALHGDNQAALNISLFLVFSYGLVTILTRPLLCFVGKQYALTLLEEFLA